MPTGRRLSCGVPPDGLGASIKIGDDASAIEAEFAIGSPIRAACPVFTTRCIDPHDPRSGSLGGVPQRSKDCLDDGARQCPVRRCSLTRGGYALGVLCSASTPPLTFKSDEPSAYAR